MATWNPIAATVPQYQKANGDLASGYYIAFEADGTSTSINMATDNTGGTTLAKCQLNDSGYPITAGSAVFIPHIDQDYKLSLYPTSTDADNKTNAEWTVDDLIAISDPSTLTVDATGVTYTNPGTGATATTADDIFDGMWLDAKTMFGVTADGVTDDTAAVQAALDAGKAVDFPEGTMLLTSTITYNDNQRVRGRGTELTIFSANHTGAVFEPANKSALYRGLDFAEFQITKSANTGTGDGLNISNSRSGSFRRFEVNSCNLGVNFDTQLDGNSSYFNTFEDLIVFNNTTNALRIAATGTDTPNANYIVRGDYRGGTDVLKFEEGENLKLDSVSVQGATTNWINSDVQFTAINCRFENSSNAILTNSGITVASDVRANIIGGTMTKGVIVGDADLVRVTGMDIEAGFPELGQENSIRYLERPFQNAGLRSGALGNQFTQSDDVTNAAWSTSGTITLTKDATDARGNGNGAVTVNFDGTDDATSNYYQNVSGSTLEGRKGYTFAIEARALTGEAGSLEVRIKQLDSGSTVIERIDNKIYLDDTWSTHSITVRFSANTVASGSLEISVHCIQNTGDLEDAIVGNHSFVVGSVPGIETTAGSAITTTKQGIIIGPDAAGTKVTISEEGTITCTSSVTTDGSVAISDGTTGGSSSAGAGNQYVELDIGGTVYKVLHDGTV